MTVFHFAGRRPDGRFVSGTVQMSSDVDALSYLRSSAVCVTALERSDTQLGRLVGILSRFAGRRKERLVLFRTVSVLVGAGIALRRAFDVAIGQCRSATFRETLQSISSDLDSGASLSVGLSRRPADFSPELVAMVRAGEIGGALEAVLTRIAAVLEREEALRRRLYAALAYPCIVATGAATLVLFLVASIVPAFSSLFAEMHESVPISTRMLILVGTHLLSPWTWLLLVGTSICAWLGWRTLRVTPATAQAVERCLLVMPIVGTIVRNLSLSQIGRVLGTLLWSGVPILRALEVCAEALAHGGYADAVRVARDELQNGRALSSAWTDGRLFPPSFIQFVRAGEEAGAMDTMLLRAAEAFESEAESALATLGTLVEPTLILFLGAVVGAIVGSILIPLYSLIGGLK